MDRGFLDGSAGVTYSVTSLYIYIVVAGLDTSFRDNRMLYSVGLVVDETVVLACCNLDGTGRPGVETVPSGCAVICPIPALESDRYVLYIVL